MSPHEVADTLQRATRALDSALAFRDTPTHDHSSRVIALARGLGEAHGLADDELECLSFCARFHDIGKIGIPDRILHKPGRLNREEYDEIKRHATIGSSIISKIPIAGIEHFSHVIEHHHERFDGKGYPNGLRGRKIPLLSRIIGIVDSYDAITSYRSYHEPDSCRHALAIIEEERGRQFDPELTDRFLAIAERDDPLFSP